MSIAEDKQIPKSEERVFLPFIRSLKKKWVFFVLALLGVVLVVWGGSSQRTQNVSLAHAETDADTYRRQLEEDLTALCAEIEGVGKVKVMVTLSAGQSQTYASGGKLTSTEMPLVCGVAVVCRGGADPRVRAEVISLISSVLGIGSHRVYVGEMR